ncbi:MAG: hypothetical protein EBU29_11845 [Gammaproteobacteria bacterium]|nr:hypothetical protein [Gammaproteobacteria bacterium]
MLNEGLFRPLREGRVLLLSLVATVVLTALFPVVAGQFGLTLLDAIADPTEARALIEGLTGEQQEAHAWITGTLDVAYPLAYGTLFLGATLRFFPRRGTLLAIPVLIGVPADLLEGLVQILALTGQADGLAAKAVLTPVKGGAFVYGAVMALLGVGLRGWKGRANAP